VQATLGGEAAAAALARDTARANLAQAIVERDGAKESVAELEAQLTAAREAQAGAVREQERLAAVAADERQQRLDTQSALAALRSQVGNQSHNQGG
jgi:hypothetical protein